MSKRPTPYTLFAAGGNESVSSYSLLLIALKALCEGGCRG